MAGGVIQNILSSTKKVGTLSLSNCSDRGYNYIVQYGDFLFVHFSVKITNTVSNGTKLAEVPSNFPKSHVTVPNILAVSGSATDSYVISFDNGQIKCGANSIPSNTQLKADFLTYVT